MDTSILALGMVAVRVTRSATLKTSDHCLGSYYALMSNPAPYHTASRPIIRFSSIPKPGLKSGRMGSGILGGFLSIALTAISILPTWDKTNTRKLKLVGFTPRQARTMGGTAWRETTVIQWMTEVAAQTDSFPRQWNTIIRPGTAQLRA